MMEYWNIGKKGKRGRMERRKRMWKKEMVFDPCFGFTHYSTIPAFHYSNS